MRISADLLVEKFSSLNEFLPLIIESRRVIFISDYLPVLIGVDEYVPRRRRFFSFILDEVIIDVSAILNARE